MDFLPTRRVRVLRADAPERARMAERLAALPPGAFRTIKAGGRACVAAVDQDGEALIVKAMAMGPRSRLASRIGRSRLQRQWRGAALLEGAGLAVARPLVLWRGRDETGRPVEALAMERVEGPTLLGVIAEGALPVRVQHELATLVGEECARIAEAGLYDRDHKPSNIVVRGLPDAPELVAIDTVGVRREIAGTHIFMLAKLYIEALGVGHPPRLALCMRAVCRSTAEDLVAADEAERRQYRRSALRGIARIVAAHGDPRPKDDPLEGSLPLS